MPPPSPPPTPAGLPTGSSATGSLTDEDEIPWAYRVDALWTLFWNDPDLLEADCVIGEFDHARGRPSSFVPKRTVRPTDGAGTRQGE